MALASDGKLYGLGWNKVILFTCLIFIYNLDRSEMVIQPTIENCVGAQLRRVLARTSCDFCIAPSPSQLLVGRNSHRVLHHRIIRVPKICTHK
ncbi:hypothetical protein NC653_013145 [Populus alba x Populus x berolinensis]|uniref:Uncharacterized protein n=1 Tax=Populus alba x Populus x berolinensis TaxID=444605 RepID=A0AAD6W295_9ROSI|nr:hypothetical protein NC653_013145 [Populus alba x Populus x berolinensis]